MTGLVRKATLLSACGVLMAGAAMAGLPNGANSTCNGGQCTTAPTVIVIADTENPDVDAQCYTASFTIRDAANDPVQGTDVVLDFFNCAGSDLPSVCLTQPDPGVIVSGINKTVTKNADGTGTVTFRIWGNGTIPGPSVASCIRVYSQSQLLSTGLIKWRLKKYDINNTGGTVNAADGNAFLDLVNAPPGPNDLWGDYNCTNTTLISDGPAFIKAVGRAVCTGPAW